MALDHSDTRTEILGRILGKIAKGLHRRPLVVVFTALVLTGLASVFAGRLTLSTDLAELLPQSFESVQGLEKLRTRFGGIGYVVVVGKDAEPSELKRFADEIQPKLAALPSIRFVDYQRPTGFFEDRALYYLGVDDLKTVKSRIDEREAWEKRSRNPLYLQFDDEEAPSLDFADIMDKYAGATNTRLSGTGEAYYLDVEQKTIVLLAKPNSNSMDLAFSKSVVADVEKVLADHNMASYGPNFKVSLTGTFKKKLDEQAQVSNDLRISSIIAFILLLAYLTFHFRSLLAVAIITIPVLVSLTWTYGIVGATYGSVNLLTGFLGAILGGLGIEHGIHLLSRYEMLRAQRHSEVDAVEQAFAHTGSAALVSSLVAALTFLSLSLSEFRAFHEFGVIAAVGMIVAILAYVLLLPTLLRAAEWLRWRPRLLVDSTDRQSYLAKLLRSRPMRLAWVLGVLVVLAIINMRNVRFDYDFSSLSDADLPSFRLDHEVNRILGYSQTPVVVLAENSESERMTVNYFNERKKVLGAKSTVDFVAALDELVPTAQPEKQAIIASIRETLDGLPDSALDADAKEKIESFRKMAQATPFTRDDLPASVRRQFQGQQEGGDSGFVLIFPAVELSDGAQVRRFAEEVRGIPFPGGTKVSAAGEAMILADILNMVTRESGPILGVACITVILMMWLMLGSLPVALTCMLPTVLSILVLVGVMPLADLDFNYLNIAIVPVLIGITVDAGVHLVSRLAEPGSSFMESYLETGRAIAGGMLTSVIGFSALFVAQQPGLRSVAELANLGFAVNVLVVLVGFPAALLLVNRRTAAHAMGSEDVAMFDREGTE